MRSPSQSRCMALESAQAIAMRSYASRQELWSKPVSQLKHPAFIFTGRLQMLTILNCATVSIAELTGALVVDPPGATANDEIFVLEMISEVAVLNARQTLATINGKFLAYCW